MTTHVGDECWNCGKGLPLDTEQFVEIRLMNWNKEFGTLHRSCMECAQKLPGVNEDNIQALLDPEHQESNVTVQTLRVTIDDATAKVHGSWTIEIPTHTSTDLVVEQIHATLEQLTDEEGFAIEFKDNT